MSGCVYWSVGEKLGHSWLNAVFSVITLPDPVQLLSSAGSKMLRTKQDKSSSDKLPRVRNKMAGKSLVKYDNFVCGF